MTDDERLLADLATKVRKLTDQVAFRDMLLTQIKSDLKEERAAAVAWLRKEMQPCSGPVRSTLAFAANGLEEGKHRTEDYPLGFNVWEKT